MKAVEFGGYLKSLRKKKKLTIRQLDTYSGVSNSYISQMERGERGVPSPEILLKLAKPLGVEYEELMIKAGYIKEDFSKEANFGEPETNERDMFIQEFISDLNMLPLEAQKQIHELIKTMNSK